MEMNPIATAARVSRLRPTAVNRVLQEVRHLQAAGRSLVSLMRGQPDTPTAPHIVEAAMRSLRDGRTGYPDNRGEPALRDAVAAKLLRDQGLAYDPETEILITDGATHGAHAALGALLDPEAPVLLPDPIYDAYEPVIHVWGGRPAPVRTELRDGRFTIPTTSLEEARDATIPIMLLNTPWNPVGTVLTRHELIELMGVAARVNGPVISDEIYEALVYDGNRHVSPASVSPDARERTILINSLSKTYAMTGWRVGWMIGPPDVAEAAANLQSQTTSNVANVSQRAALAAVSGDLEAVNEMRAVFDARRLTIHRMLNDCNGVTCAEPEGAFYAFPSVEGLLGSELAGRRVTTTMELADVAIDAAGVAVVPGEAFGAPGYLRLSYALADDDLVEGVRRLGELFATAS
jgi:aspartate aminotransferase